MSAEEIEIGTRWSANISQELESSKFGIICLTPDNLLEPWIYFEAGALAKVVEQARVVPLLFNLKPSDIQGPLTQFQATGFDKDDIFRLLKSINSAAGDEALEENRLQMAFSALWLNSKTPFEQSMSKTLPLLRRLQNRLRVSSQFLKKF